MRFFAVGYFVFSFAIFGVQGLEAQVAGLALVRHAPSINGTVDGSIQQMTAESSTLNGGAIITGDWLVPGTPTVRLNGHPTYAGSIDGIGGASPSGYQIILNGNSTLRNVIRRTDAVSLPTVGTLVSPTGTRSVNINSSSDSVGSFSTLRDLTLNGNVGNVAIPAGSYGNFTANGGSGFTLGVAGASQASVYNLQNVTLNGQSQFQVVGPVIVNVRDGLTANGSVGSSAHAGFLTLNISSGGFTLNGGCIVYGTVNAPNGSVTVNGNSQLVGGVTCDRLTVNGNGLLRISATVVANAAPAVSLTAPANNAFHTSPATISLAATATNKPKGSGRVMSIF